MKCNRDECYNDAIKRGKYCILHCSNARKRQKKNDDDTLNEEFIAKMLQADVWGETGGGGEEEKKETNQDKKEEDERRSLIEQQNWEYIEAEKRDRENLRLKQLEVDKKIKIRQKFASFIPQSTDIIIQFIFPEFCLKVRQRFHYNAWLQDLYDFTDLTLEDNNINLKNYQMVIYPNIIHTRESPNQKLADINIIHGVSILIQRSDL